MAQKQLEGKFHHIYLLKTALEHDPYDKLFREKLVHALAWELDYAVHEVPCGVLWGNNSASIEQCDLLKKKLNELKIHRKKSGLDKSYIELVGECELHFSEYQNYLEEKEKYKGRISLAQVTPISCGEPFGEPFCTTNVKFAEILSRNFMLRVPLFC